MKTKNTPEIKGIFFDAGDTLFETKESIGRTYSRIAARHGVQADSQILNEQFRRIFNNSPPLAFPGLTDRERKPLEFRWWRQLARSVFEDVHFDNFDLFFEELYQFYEQVHAWKLFSETTTLLSSLKMKGYFLGIISNFDSRLPGICALLDISDYFDDVTYSSREGKAKPAPEIFEIALKRAQLKPSESIHIGDSLKHDVDGSEKAGMMSIWLDRKRGPSQNYRGRRITTLSGIFEYL